MADTRFLDFTETNAPTPSDYILISNASNGVRKTTIEHAVASAGAVTDLQDNAISWGNALVSNFIPRGKDLTAYFDSGEMSTDIAKGDFSNIRIGDYIKKSIIGTDNRTYYTVESVVLDCDYIYGVASKNTSTKHHVVMGTNWGGQYFGYPLHSSADLSGGFVSTDMWKTYLPKIVSKLKDAFGEEHLDTWKEYLSDAISDEGKATSYSLYECQALIPSYGEVTGIFDEYKGLNAKSAFGYSRKLSLMPYYSGIHPTGYSFWLRSPNGIDKTRGLSMRPDGSFASDSVLSKNTGYFIFHLI